MKGDFTRNTYDPGRHYNRVLQQQGRVALDADFNEQAAIVLHHLRVLTRDLFGAYGGPADGNGFLIAIDLSGATPKLTISAGHYYVDGLLVENDAPCDYAGQPDWTPAPPDANGQGGDALLAWLASNPRNVDQRYWLYLDVWERHITWIEDDAIREPALGGPDTGTRAKTLWQVKALPWDPAWNQSPSPCTAPLGSLTTLSTALLGARIDPGPGSTDPCIIAPGAAYRGAENQLYRVEIQRGGDASQATFKWSRDNGSTATRWLGSEGAVLLAQSGRGFCAGDWVELTHDALELAGLPGQLLLLAVVEGDRLTIDPASVPAAGQMAWSADYMHPKLRRWNQSGNDQVTLVEGAVPVQETPAGGESVWLDLEDGVQVEFAAGGSYRSGDYWLIPARVATGGLLWPLDAAGQTLLQPPAGIEHHYAPLGMVLDSDGLRADPSCRRCVEVPEVACRVSTALQPRARAPRARPPAAAPASTGGPGARTRGVASKRKAP
ncbi:MAG: hypothetical protein KGL18_20515 [Burkholderiales bacterium]|nr:DUF4815 domain-containing protein [Burkholderiales bacterium]MDE1926035.1 hypothetical protein [Burkholderiales bacterium]MDE2505353.1 hypothetical protein [Burkholderiales bacterium]